MSESELRSIRRSAEYIPKMDINHLKSHLRGIYVLYREQQKHGKKKRRYDVRYIGMSAGQHLGIKGRLRQHAKSKRKSDEWTHFSVFEVWDNVTSKEIRELEGFARHIYRYDVTASTLNIQRGYQGLRSVRNKKIETWD